MTKRSEMSVKTSMNARTSRGSVGRFGFGSRERRREDELHLRRVAESTVVLVFMFESEANEAPRLALADALSKP
jgi:hypothetical protein